MIKTDRIGEFEQIVLLALLRLRDNAYGMTIRREIESRTGKRTSLGAVYTTLGRLEQKGYVSSRMGDATPERGGRAKRFFKIEAAGQSALQTAESRRAAMSEGLVPSLGGL